MKAFVARIAAIAMGIFLSYGFAPLAQDSGAAVEGGLDAQTAIFVIGLLVIVLGGLVLYELVVRGQAR
jgi:hypothetical protein